MFKMLVILYLFLSSLFANTFSVASYNVENFFDLTYDKTEYKEYIPNNSYNWNKTTYKTKLSNIIKVIKQLDASIIALQEVESIKVLKQLQTALPQYRYISFSKYKNSSVGLAVLSKIKILDTKKISVNFENRLFRPIQEVTFKYKNSKFRLFNNHWSSKRFDERYRAKFAYKLFERVKKLPKDFDYILLGDFNSNYNEFETFLYDKKLNTTSNITGINHVLNTTINKNFVYKNELYKYNKRVHYNLWLELNYQNRFSYFFKAQKQTPDNIILSPALFDKKRVSYINNSFKVFKPKYLFKKNKINRWKMKNRVHQNSGFSDHLPIIASFKIEEYEKEKEQTNINTIEKLYKVENLLKPVILKDCIVILKEKNSVVLKQKNSRAIFLYKKENNFKLGNSYDIEVNKIKRYNGLKEISKFEILKEKNIKAEVKKFYIKEVKDFKLEKYQNEIVTNLKGRYKRNYFYYDKYKIRLYFKNKELKPKKESKLLIKKAHVGFFRSNPQLIIYKHKDFELIN